MRPRYKTEVLVAAILTTPTRQAAADKAGIPLSSLYDYLRKPKFKAALAEAKALLIPAAVEVLKDGYRQGLEELRLQAAQLPVWNRRAWEILSQEHTREDLEHIYKAFAKSYDAAVKLVDLGAPEPAQVNAKGAAPGGGSGRGLPALPDEDPDRPMAPLPRPMLELSPAREEAVTAAVCAIRRALAAEAMAEATDEGGACEMVDGGQEA